MMDNSSSKNHKRQNASKGAHPDDTISSRNEPKLAKTQVPKSSHENTIIHVAITTKNYSDLSKKELELLKTKIEKMYAEYYSETRKDFPIFAGKPEISAGVLKIVCESEFTKDWIEGIIHEIKINCAPEKLPLKLIQQKDLPTKVKCHFTISENIIELNKLQSTLHNMNAGFGVDKWTFHNAIETDSGDLYVEVGIPRELLSRSKKSLMTVFDKVKINEIEDSKQAAALNPVNNLEEAGPSGFGKALEPNEPKRRRGNRDTEQQKPQNSIVEPIIEPDDSRRRRQSSPGFGKALEPDVPKRRREDRDPEQQRPRNSMIDPIMERDDSRRRRQSSPDEYRNIDPLLDFFRLSRCQTIYPEFVMKKCQLAESAIGTTITEQHLVVAVVSSLTDPRITRELMKHTPKNLKELQDNLNKYNYCDECDKTGHTRLNCRRIIKSENNFYKR